MSARTRPAHANDLPALTIIEALCFGPPRNPDNLAGELTRSWSRLVVIEHADEVVAYVNYWCVADEIEVIQVATHPGHQRRGHGRRALVHALDEARTTGATRALLEVRPSNTAAVALYESLGFVEVNRREKYYDDGEDALVMALALV